jgi:hypothetical protein
MKRLALAAAVLPLLLSACGGPRPTLPEFLDVSRQILAFAEQDARQNQPGRPSDGPLYVNLNSFRHAATRVTGETISEDSISRALGEPTHALQEQVMLCDTVGFGGCWLRKYGVWINLNMMRHAGGEMTAYVRTTSTDRRSRPSAWCDRIWVMDFQKQENGQWRLARRRLSRDCTQPRE